MLQRTQIALKTSQPSKYHILLKRVLDGSRPAKIEEHGRSPGVLQTIVYVIPAEDIPRIFFESGIFPPLKAQRVEIIFYGGNSLKGMKDARADLIYHLPDLYPENLRLISSLPNVAVITEAKEKETAEQMIQEILKSSVTKGSESENLSKIRVSEYGLQTVRTELSSLTQEYTAQNENLLWLKAIFMGCQRARHTLTDSIEFYARHPEKAELQGKSTFFETAYKHIYRICKNYNCQEFANDWSAPLHRNPQFSWEELCRKHGDLLKKWGILLPK